MSYEYRKKLREEEDQRRKDLVDDPERNSEKAFRPKITTRFIQHKTLGRMIHHATLNPYLPYLPYLKTFCDLRANKEEVLILPPLRRKGRMCPGCFFHRKPKNRTLGW